MTNWLVYAELVLVFRMTFDKEFESSSGWQGRKSLHRDSGAFPDVMLNLFQHL